MSLFAVVVSLVLTGLVIGALGRLVVPGPNPMSLGMTILVGIGGAFLGGVVGALVGNHWVLTLVLEIAAAAGLVVLVSRRSAGSRVRR